MKKIFWTSIFWIALVVLFWAYLRLFNNTLGEKVASWMYKTPIIMQTGIVEAPEDTTPITEQLTKINEQLTNMLQVMNAQKNIPTAPTTTQVMMQPQTTQTPVPVQQQVQAPVQGTTNVAPQGVFGQ